MSAAVRIEPLTAADAGWVRPFIVEQWGAEEVTRLGELLRPHELPGFVAREGANLAGLLTYRLDGVGGCEVVTVDSGRPRGAGVGTALLAAVEQAARAAGCGRVWPITTNDNLDALRFYQRRGFELVALHRRAVVRARPLKPSIPLVGAYGIPLRDELELERPLVPHQERSTLWRSST